VAVVGAGAAGLVAARCLRDRGFAVRVLEKTDSVGGVWKYRRDDVMYRSLVTNLPKEIMCYPGTASTGVDMLPWGLSQ
jgi:cation diffusion facilitator CzcD-associated flavoprotein CzcO